MSDYIPKHTDVSIETIRGFFNAFLLHKHFIDYLVSQTDTELVYKKTWVYLTRKTDLRKSLENLQDVLNFNVKNLAQLVRQTLCCLIMGWWYNFIILQLNTTCNACSSNHSLSATVKLTLTNTMEDECNGPIYNVVKSIAKHAKKLSKTVNKLKDSVAKNKDDMPIAKTSNININHLYLCST